MYTEGHAAIVHGFCHGTSSIGQVYPRDAGCAGSPDEVAELPLDVAMSSSLELFRVSTVPVDGFWWEEERFSS